MANDELNIPPEEVETQRKRAFVASGLGWGLDGFDWTMFAYALPAITASLSLSASDGPFVVAVSLVASAFGGVVGGTLADRFGRVRVLTFVILGYSLFSALTATAQNLEQLLLWRTLHGFTFGAEWAVGAALLAEYANPKQRGRTMGFLQSTYAIGWAASTAAYLILFDALNDDQAWRYLFLLGILPAAAAFFIRLTTRDRVKTGASKGSPISFPLLFRPEIRRTSILATLFGVGGQGTYYSVFVFLPTFLVEERGQTVVGTATYSWVVIAGSFVGYILAGFIHDALGRRPAFTLYFLGSAAAIVAFVTVPIDGSFVTYAVSLLPGLLRVGPGRRLRVVPGRAVPLEHARRRPGARLQRGPRAGRARAGLHRDHRGRDRPGRVDRDRRPRCLHARHHLLLAAAGDARQGDRRGGARVPAGEATGTSADGRVLSRQSFTQPLRS